MSSRHLRKLQQEVPQPPAELSSSSEEEESPPARRNAGFSALMGSDSDPSSSSESEVEEPPPPPIEVPAPKPKAKKKKPAKKKTDDWDDLLPAVEEVPAPEGGSQSAEQEDEYCMWLDKDLFDINRELSRQMGGEVKQKGQKAKRAGNMVHHRKLWIHKPDEPWPRPDSALKMHALDTINGSHTFQMLPDSGFDKSYDLFQKVIMTQDPNQLQGLLHKNQFFVPTLLAFVEIWRQQSENERAFTFLCRALYALECGFHPSFQPFKGKTERPDCKLHLHKDNNMGTWLFVKAIWMYMATLQGQGIFRSCLEVNKLIIVMCYPHDPVHALLHLDGNAIRAKSFSFLTDFCRLFVAQHTDQDVTEKIAQMDILLPNFAYSLALAKFLQCTSVVALDKVSLVSIDDLKIVRGTTVRPEADEDADPLLSVHATMMRALLYHPSSLRILLEALDVEKSGGLDWLSVLAAHPFLEMTMEPSHIATLHKISNFMAEKNKQLWKNDAVLRWMHRCASRLVDLYKSDAFRDILEQEREALAGQSDTLIPIKEYENVFAAENTGVYPAELQEQEEHLGLVQRVQQHGDMEVPGTVSIYSPVIVVFLQTFLPWATLDRTGRFTEPFRWSQLPGIIARNCVGFVKSCIELAKFLASHLREGLVWFWDWIR